MAEWKTSRANGHVVLRRGRTRTEMRGKYCELANKTTQQLHKVPTSVGELSKVFSQIVLKYLYFVRIGRPDILWSVNKLARAVTKWTRACDKRLARLISCIHCTHGNMQCCHVGNTLFWENQHHSWTIFTWDVLNLNAKQGRIVLKITGTCLNLGSLLE